MKALTALFALTTAALGLVCLIQFQTLRQRDSQLAQLQSQEREMSDRIVTLKEGQERAAAQRKALLDQSEELATQLQARQTAPTQEVLSVAATVPPAPAAPNDNSLGGFGKMIGKMMQDPDMKKFIRDQQRGMMDQLYAPLIKQLGLTDTEAAGLKDLLAENMMKGAEKASSLLGSTNPAAMAGTFSADQKDFEEQVKGFLGEDRYAKYEAYQQTLGERTQLNLFKQQNAGTASALSDPQMESLLTIMQEERKYITSLTGESAPANSQNQGNLQAVFSPDQTDKMLGVQEQVNQRVYQRAMSLLSPDQLAAFGAFQTNQLQMMRMSMNMARKMFNPDNSDTPPPPGNP